MRTHTHPLSSFLIIPSILFHLFHASSQTIILFFHEAQPAESSDHPAFPLDTLALTQTIGVGAGTTPQVPEMEFNLHTAPNLPA